MNGRNKKFRLNRFLSFVILFLIIIIPVQAQNLVYEQWTEISLVSTCFNNGTFCSSSANCNSTIVNPLGSVIIANHSETKQGDSFNVSISSGLTGNTGTYTVFRSCTDSGGDISGKGEESYTFLVTPSGFDDDSRGYLIFLFIGAFFSIGMIMFGIFIQDPPLTLLGGMLLFLFGITTLTSGVGNYRNDLTEWSSLVVIFIASYVSVRTGMEMIDG